MKMSEPKLTASQPDITTWLSGALETLIQLESGRNVVEGLPASVLMFKECQTDTAAQPAMMVTG